MKRVVYSIFSVIISISCIFSGFLKVNATMIIDYNFA